MTRRLAVVVVLVLALVQGALPLAQGVATNQRPAGTLAGEWAADAGLTAQLAAAEHQFQTNFPTNALMVHWTRAGVAEDVAAEVSVSQDGRNWSEWLLAPVDEDSDGPFVSDRRYTGMVMVAPSRYVRVRAIDGLGQPGVVLPDLRVSYVNTLAGPETDSLTAQTAGAAGATADELVAAQTGGVSIIPRASWGADEKLRFRNGREAWPRQYQIPEKVIIHHTETANDQDPMAAVRAVYYFHAVVRGWGDIGYNYLIDRNGRIYEGRIGGDNVIAGHALQYNYGSIGIAVMGSFQTTTITPQTEQAIVNLITAKARYIDPVGETWFVDRMLPNIMGHRDCLNTACPGNAFYPRLPAIRDKVLRRIGYRPTLDARITGVEIGPASLRTGDRLQVRVTLTNTGSAVLPSDEEGPGLLYVDTQDFTTRGMPKVTGKFRIAVEAAGTTGMRYPYRWGAGRALLPGESATVTGFIQMTTPKERTFTVALVQEYVKYWQQGLSPTRVTVTGPPVSLPTPPPLDATPPPSTPGSRGPLPTDRKPPPAVPDPERTYVPETGHFVSSGFRYYWEKNGGLAQFGYPLTEEFEEINLADGQPYIVQYFERARFEYHPEHKGTQYEVLLGLLGNQTVTGRSFSESPPEPRPREGGRYFPETRQWVSGAILKYWTDHGGLMMYGYPISPAFMERNPDDGKTYLVQYFERNRFEYHPENAGTPHEVLLGHLGRQVLVERGWLTR